MVSKKKTLNKDIKKSFAKSKGRFISIMCLMMLGSFALVGLKVSGPDMRSTTKDYFEKYNTADLSIMGSYGLSDNDIKVINTWSDRASIEYGYLKDVAITDTLQSLRIQSVPSNLSLYEITEGQLPVKENEIAIATKLKDEYAIGDTIHIDEKKNIDGNYSLKETTYTIVGYVNSSEIVSTLNQGPTTVGTGELSAYALVSKDAFATSTYSIARLRLNATKDLDPYSREYIDTVATYKRDLTAMLDPQAQDRYHGIHDEFDEKIADGTEELNDAKDTLTSKKTELNNAKNELSDAQSKLNSGAQELETAKGDIASGETSLNQGKQEYQGSLQEYQTKKVEYDNGVTTLTQKRTEARDGELAINSSQAQLDMKKAELESGKSAYEDGIKQYNLAIVQTRQKLEGENLSEQERFVLTQTLAAIEDKKLALETEQQTFLNDTYNPSIELLKSNQSQLDTKKEELNTAKLLIESSQQSLDDAKAQLDDAKLRLSDGERDILVNEEKLASAKVELRDGETTLTNKQKEFEDGVVKYDDGLALFNEKQEEADIEIPKNEEKIKDAKAQLEKLEVPSYSIVNRRELLGSEGNKVYESVSQIVDSLADIFPIFLYFVAALVTFTTMTRFVDEERINSGTLKALGYDDKDVIKKFAIYGLISSLTGSILGIILGHTLLPMIVYTAYAHAFSLPHIQFNFYPMITLIALGLALVSAVIPAVIVAYKELQDNPARLLLPKPPVSGSKILLEHITPIWSRMSFTHKVTARNIFRYKQRMLMTIFGVCGSAALLFAGLGVRNSIAVISSRQFEDILHYDMIMATQQYVDDEESDAIQSLLNSNEIDSYAPVHYEPMTTIAGDHHDEQHIEVIIPQDSKQLEEYISLYNPKSKDLIDIDQDGIIVSKRLADLQNLSIGDTMTLSDEHHNDYEVKVSDISELYMGHLVIMNKDVYEKTMTTTFDSNAQIIRLVDNTKENTEILSSRFIDQSGVKAVVQNTTLIDQANTIVASLDIVMKILVLVASLLAIVILYNLTNINVSERIRELSTIKVLGFYDEEVTMYIYRETIILSAIGILVGFLFGFYLHSYIITVVPPDDVIFNPAVGALAYIMPAIIIVLVSAILGVFVNRRLKNVDMLEALKSVE